MACNSSRVYKRQKITSTVYRWRNKQFSGPFLSFFRFRLPLPESVLLRFLPVIGRAGWWVRVSSFFGILFRRFRDNLYCMGMGLCVWGPGKGYGYQSSVLQKK